MMAVAIVAVAGLAVYTNQPKEEMTDVMLANIEALADGENGGIINCCNDRTTCAKDFCGTFYPANGTGAAIVVYYQ